MDQASSDLPTIRAPGGPFAQGQLAQSGGAQRQLGNYRLIQRIAQGGFAEVYLGEHIYLNTFAAIKVLHTYLESSDLEIFRQEASIIARLRHPHIVSIHDFDVKDGVPFLVMDYAPNGTLRQRHPRGVRLTPAACLPYLKQIAEGLQYAHDQRFIHRDIKPENMLIGERDDILLSDFGIAVVFSTHTHSDREIVGTITYMAPEQLQGKPVIASDQYSLGVVLYEWLAGDCPFKGSLGEVSAQHVNMPPPPLVGRLNGISPALEAVVMRALAKNPAERFATAIEFAFAFESAMQQQPLRLRSTGLLNLPSLTEESSPYAQTMLAKPALPVEPSTPPPRSLPVSRRTLLLGMAGLVALGGVGGLASWIVGKSRQIQAPLPSPTVIPKSTVIPRGTLYHTYRGHHASVQALACSADGTYVASASKDATVQVWDAATGGNHAATYSGHTDVVNAVAWSPDEKNIASGSNDRTVRVWNTSDASLKFAYGSHADVVNAVIWSPDGTRIASGSNDKTVQVWNAVDGSSPVTFSLHSGPVFAVAWSPDGTLIASGGADKTVRVWKPDGTPVYIYGGHTNIVSGLAWSRNGALIASASQDGTVQVWGATDGSNAYSYTGHSGAVNTVAWLPQPGPLVVSGSADTTVQIWQGE